MAEQAALVTFGNWLRSLREKTYVDGRTMTQFDTAVRTGLTPAAISRLEQGTIGKPAFEDVCRLLFLYRQPLEEAAERLGYPVPPHEVFPAEIDPELGPLMFSLTQIEKPYKNLVTSQCDVLVDTIKKWAKQRIEHEK